MVLSLGVIICLTLFVCNAFNMTEISDAQMESLAKATIAQVGGLLGVALKFLFSRNRDG